MKRINSIPVMLFIFVIAVCQGYDSYADDMRIMKDGSVRYTSPDGREKIISMDGKTPYGMDIKEERNVLRRRDFVVELVYSAQLSDDNMDKKYIAPFFKELESQIVRWMHNHRVPRKKIQIVVSNCRFCKTGFCKRKNKREITIIRFADNKEEKKISFKHEDLISKKKHPEIAAKAVEVLFGE